MPEHVLYAEPAGRRMRVEPGGAVVASSDGAILLHETGRYPVAYFPPHDVATGLLRTSSTRSRHPELGVTVWASLEVGGHLTVDAVWSHPQPRRTPQR